MGTDVPDDSRLQEAVRYGDLQEVNEALKDGDCPNKIGLYQWSPLHEAAHIGEMEIINLLLKHSGKSVILGLKHSGKSVILGLKHSGKSVILGLKHSGKSVILGLKHSSKSVILVLKHSSKSVILGLKHSGKSVILGLKHSGKVSDLRSQTQR